MATSCDWKQEVAKKRVQRERETDVERRWQDVMSKNGEGAPEWLKEAALKKKALIEKDTTTAPWMKEVQRTNAALARKLSEVKKAELETATDASF